MKTKVQRQQEAVERKLQTMNSRKQRLLRRLRDHHEDTSNTWTYKHLKAEIDGFYSFLREVGLPHGDHAFTIENNQVLLRPTSVVRVGGSPDFKCPMCLRLFGQYHAEPCDVGVHIWPYEAIFKE